MEPQANLTEKYMSFGTLYFKLFNVLLIIEEYKIKLVCRFLYFLLFYIASEFTTSADIIFNIHWSNGFTQTHRPLAKHDKSFSLMLPKFRKFLVLYLGCGSMT